MNDTLMDDQSNETVDPNKNYLEEFVGEGRPFKTPEDLARSKHESNQFIKKLQSEMAELRQDYLKLREEHNAGPKLQELIDRLSTQNTQQQTSSVQPQANVVTQQATVDPKQIESLVSNKIHEYESQKTELANFNRVRDKLIERHGKSYQNVLKQQIDDLGLSIQEVDYMARRHPKVLERTLGLDQEVQRETFQTPPRSEHMSQFTPKVQKRTWSYYQNLKKTEPNVYWDPKTQVQMHHDSQELGDAFQDGDWSKYN